jgi:hypothetical protein
MRHGRELLRSSSADWVAVMTDLIAIAAAALGLTLSEPVPLAGSDRSTVMRCHRRRTTL